MDTVVTNIAEELGVERVRVEKAVGIILHLVKSEGDPALVPDLMKDVAGADELADAQADSSGVLLGAMEGAPGGGTMAAFIKLWKVGLNPQEIRRVGELLFAHIMSQHGEDRVKVVLRSIPGLEPYL